MPGERRVVLVVFRSWEDIMVRFWRRLEYVVGSLVLVRDGIFVGLVVVNLGSLGRRFMNGMFVVRGWDWKSGLEVFGLLNRIRLTGRRGMLISGMYSLLRGRVSFRLDI